MDDDSRMHLIRQACAIGKQVGYMDVIAHLQKCWSSDMEASGYTSEQIKENVVTDHSVDDETHNRIVGIQ